jgi:hypothetical protein
MQTRVDAKLRLEARHFALRFTCEHCVHFANPASGDAAASPKVGCCSLGYPILPHHEVDLERVESLAFCKEFELY